MSTLTALALIAAGVVNFIAGFLGLFPGLFEAGTGRPEGGASGSVGLVELLGTPYGRYAVGHLFGAGLQVAGAQLLRSAVLTTAPMVHVLALLAAASLGLEGWGWALKGSLSLLSLPGFAAAGLCLALYGQRLRGRG